jgi:hypothetical protein
MMGTHWEQGEKKPQKKKSLACFCKKIWCVWCKRVQCLMIDEFNKLRFKA